MSLAIALPVCVRYLFGPDLITNTSPSATPACWTNTVQRVRRKVGTIALLGQQLYLEQLLNKCSMFLFALLPKRPNHGWPAHLPQHSQMLADSSGIGLQIADVCSWYIGLLKHQHVAAVMPSVRHAGRAAAAPLHSVRLLESGQGVGALCP